MFGQTLKLNRNDLCKLTKILEMTTSENPAEALAATRKASQILSNHGTNYHMLMENLQNMPNLHYWRRVRELENKVKNQKIEIASLKDERKNNTPARKQLKFLGPIQELRKFLMKNLTLRTHERTLLEGCNEIIPKSKEAYMILICARRHGVDYVATGSE